MVVQEGGAGGSDTRGSLKGEVVTMEVEPDRLVVSLCCMQAVMKKITTVQEYNNRFEGMVDQGANIGVGPPALASLLDLPIEPHTDGRKIGTADAEGSLTIVGWIIIPGYAGRIALVEGAAFLLLSVIHLQQNGNNNNRSNYMLHK